MPFPLIMAVLAGVLAVSWLLGRTLPCRHGWRAPTIAAAILLLLAAIDIRVETGDGGETFLLIDISSSTGIDDPDAGRLQSLAGVDPNRCRLLVFGESPVWLSGTAGRDERSVAEAASLAGRGGSDLAAALREVARVASRGDSVVVFTDGRTGPGGLVEVGSRLGAGGIGIRVESLGRSRSQDVRVRAVRAPSWIPAGMGVDLETLLEGAAGRRGSLDVHVDGIRRRRVQFTLGESGSARVKVALRRLEEGYRTIVATLWPADADAVSGNDRLGTGVVVGSRRRAMLVNVDDLRSPLQGLGFDVTVRTTLGDLARCDLLVLGNVKAVDLPSAGRGVRDFVREGGGLLVLGGANSFGPGGYSGRPIEDCLPVLSRPDGEGLMLVLLLDCSGSMNRAFGAGEALSKAEAARNASLTVAGMLPGETEVYVVRFSSELLGIPRRLNAGGEGFLVELRRELTASHDLLRQTRFEPPLRWALDTVQKSGAPRSLAMLVTDGQLVGEESEKRLIELAHGIPALPGRHHLHVLAVGEDADLSFLRRLSGTEEAFTVVPSEGRMTSAFLQALLSVEGAGLLVSVEEAVVDRKIPGAPFTGALPPVRGRVRTYPREGAAVWYATGTGDPLIAGWRYGLGKAVAVLTDPLGEWGGAWANTQVLAALADDTARMSSRGGRRAEASTEGNRLRLKAYCDVELPGLGGRLLTSDGQSLSVALSASGEGEFAGEVPLPKPGAARLTLAGGIFDGGLSVPYSADYAVSGPDPVGIARLRGRLGHNRPVGPRGRAIGHWLALLAVAIFLLDRFLLLLKRGPFCVR